jgi:hypothetical protein
MEIRDTGALRDIVFKALEKTQVVDVHTHVYDPALGDVLLWGIDELLTYHYLVAEVFRARPQMKYDQFWAMSKQQQADLIWQELFIKRSPISEACRGVLTVLKKLDLDPNIEDLSGIREYFTQYDARSYVDKVFETSGVSKIYMTNDPLDPAERPQWENSFDRDPRFLGVLRLDSALMNWPAGAEKLKTMGYEVDSSLSDKTITGVRKYLNDWCDRFDARYMAISLPPTFAYPDGSPVTTLMSKAVFETARERKIPVGMMIGVKKLVNPDLGDAGDSVGKADVDTVERIARDFPDVKFMITMLARENMHGLCIAARKFSNILPFGCWWFLNNPSLVREITAMRLELLGLSFIPQHSDARVLDQLIYKWTHSRKVIGEVLVEKYSDMQATGFNVTGEKIVRDLKTLFEGTLI